MNVSHLREEGEESDEEKSCSIIKGSYDFFPLLETSKFLISFFLEPGANILLCSRGQSYKRNLVLKRLN